MPIIIAALAAEKGDLLLIENPEVHLHPSGQALIGQFLAEVAQAGIQVIVESHSDHVLNGIRRAVKSCKIDSRDVVLHFFSARHDGEVPYRSPRLASDGTINQWPTGFFDQFDKDMNFFAGWED
jgi:predicted ATPase